MSPLRVSLHSADLHYSGGLVLHTASSGSIPHLREIYLRLDDGETTGIGEVRTNIAYLKRLGRCLTFVMFFLEACGS